MNILDPTKDAAALTPLADELEAKAIDAVVARIIPALKEAGLDMLDGLTLTTVTTITRKVK